MVGPINTVQGNQVGVQVDGNSTQDTIAGNVIGSINYTPGTSNTDGLGNLFGVDIANTTSITVNSTGHIARNVSVGVAIVGPAADNNVVQGDFIQANGAYASSLTIGNQTGIKLIDYATAARSYYGPCQLGPALRQRRLHRLRREE